MEPYIQYQEDSFSFVELLEKRWQRSEHHCMGDCSVMGTLTVSLLSFRWRLLMQFPG